MYFRYAELTKKNPTDNGGVVLIVEMYNFASELFSAAAMKAITSSHGSVTMQCCKGDTSSQWEKANLPLSRHPHPFTGSHQILHT